MKLVDGIQAHLVLICFDRSSYLDPTAYLRRYCSCPALDISHIDEVNDTLSLRFRLHVVLARQVSAAFRPY